MNVTDDASPLYGKKLRTEIVIPDHVTPSLNQTLRWHYRDKTQIRKFYEKVIWAATRNQHPGQVRLEIYRHSSGTLDLDNFIGGTKSLVDALRSRNVIIDDTPLVIVDRVFEQVKTLSDGPKMTVVIIEDI